MYYSWYGSLWPQRRITWVSCSCWLKSTYPSATLPRALGNHRSPKNRSPTSSEIGKNKQFPYLWTSLSITWNCLHVLTCVSLWGFAHYLIATCLCLLVRSCFSSTSCICVVYTQRWKNGQWSFLVSYLPPLGHDKICSTENLFLHSLTSDY